MERIQERQEQLTMVVERPGIQSCAYLLELSLDWIVRRSSENIHHLLSESHVTLIDEPLSKFVHAQALHDLRNLFSRLSGTTGIGRAYKVRLTDEHEYFDVAFQLSDGRVLLELVPASETYGEYFGTVGGLIAGLSDAGGQALLDGGARRMRALTGYDRVTLRFGSKRAQSTRGTFGGEVELSDGLPPMLADAATELVELFPRSTDPRPSAAALFRACDEPGRSALHRCGVRACMRIPFGVDGTIGEFFCENRTPRAPNLELHAAAELFAQSFTMLLKIKGSAER